MKNSETLIEHQEQKLSQLLADLSPVLASGEKQPDWAALLRSQWLAMDVDLEAADLAYLFLGEFFSWESLRKRRHILGLPEVSTPDSEEWRGTVSRLMSDEGLKESLAKRLLEAAMEFQQDAHATLFLDAYEEQDEADQSILEALYHRAIHAEKTLTLMERLDLSASVGQKLSSGLNTPVTPFQVFQQAQELQYRALSSRERCALRQWLNNFTQASLAFPRLQQGEGGAMQYTYDLMKDNHYQVPIPQDVDLSPETVKLLSDLFLCFDFDQFFDGFKDGIPPAPTWAGGHDEISIIPSSGDDEACRPVLLAFARGKSGKHGYLEVIKKVKNHLIECRDTIQLVIVVTDWWDSRLFMKNDFDELSAWYRTSNIHFEFAAVGAPRDQLSSLAVDLW